MQLTLFRIPEMNSTLQRLFELDITLRRLHRKVFLYGPESTADRKYFMQEIVRWLQSENNEKYQCSLTKLAWNMTWEQNDGGRTCKYLYFNENIQQLYL